MAELRIGVLTEIIFNLIPVTFIIANSLTGCTDGQKALKGFHLRQGFLQPGDQC